MDEAVARAEEQISGPETPEDVAILYSWANLPGAKYRDFSASRREYRAQQRAKVAEAQRQAELKAARELEQAAQREIEEAQKLLEETKRSEAQAIADAEDKKRAEEALRLAEERAEQERQVIQRRQQSAEELRQQAERAREEMLEARKRAEEQASRYTETRAHVRTRADSGPRTPPGEIPGEITDPYYYSGHVDPAYFASTPGVRTAQAARVSTERRAYVYPVHPGSDEFGSGTINAFRSATHFGPSPVQPFSVRTDQVKQEQSTPLEVAPTRPLRFTEVPEVQTAELESAYQEGGIGPQALASGLNESAQDTRDTAQPDLHIRPAMRASSGDHDRYIPPPRRSPLPNLSVPSPRPLRVDAAAVPIHSFGENTRNESIDGTRPAPLRVTPLVTNVYGADRRAGEKTYLPSFGSEDRKSAEGSSSRMFIPTPRRRVLGLPVQEPFPALSGEEAAAESRVRDDAAAEGSQRSHAETAAREAEERFVQDQETSSEPAEDLHAGAAFHGRAADVRATVEPRSPWRGGSRFGETAFRRKREGDAEVSARSVRQQRLPREQQQSAEGHGEGESTQPAWLTTERPVAVRADVQSVAEDEVLDPAPKPEEGTQAHGEKQMVVSSSEEPMGLRNESEPARKARVSTGPKENAPERWRGAADLRPATHAGDDSASDTLQQSRERVASRWFALGGIMGSEDRRKPDQRDTAPRPAPLLSVLSISGGVGKTSIVATLGRALSSKSEKVLLVDTHVHGILPYYFGAREQRPGTVRTFTPPPGSPDAPVVLVSYDSDMRGHDDAAQARVVDDLQRRAQESQRVLMDVGVNSAWLVRKLAAKSPYVLVPVAADMNSVIGTQAVERLFQDIVDENGLPVKPYYVLNQFDAAMPLHLDVREVMRQFLGERLLPIVLHRTPAVSEALAEGMTVIDYAPGTPIAEDYMNLAAWVQHLAEPGISYARPARWSER